MTVAAFSPYSVPPAAAEFARSVVALAAPGRPARAKALLFATSKLAAFFQTTGLGLEPSLVLCEASIDRFVASCVTRWSQATCRTLRSNLRFVASRVLTPSTPPPAAISRGRAKVPYEPAEIDAYLGLAGAQPTLARRMRATGLICLGAGAGLLGEDLRSIRGRDVIVASGGLVVVVAGRRARTVPVLPRYHEALSASGHFAGDTYVTGGDDPSRHNVTTPLISALSGGVHLDRLDTGRLRSTWLAECARRIGLPAFMAAAGVSCSQRLGDVVSFLPVPGEEQMVALLGSRP